MAKSSPVDVVVRLAPKVEIGFGTAAGIVGALGQYAGAVALFLTDTSDAGAIVALGTATATLSTTIAGRMAQAVAAIKAAKPAAPPVVLGDVARERGLGLEHRPMILGDGPIVTPVPPPTIPADLDDGAAHELTDGRASSPASDEEASA